MHGTVENLAVVTKNCILNDLIDVWHTEKIFLNYKLSGVLVSAVDNNAICAYLLRTIEYQYYG